jgi:hypothetical protein
MESAPVSAGQLEKYRRNKKRRTDSKKIDTKALAVRKYTSARDCLANLAIVM